MQKKKKKKMSDGSVVMSSNLNLNSNFNFYLKYLIFFFFLLFFIIIIKYNSNINLNLYAVDPKLSCFNYKRVSIIDNDLKLALEALEALRLSEPELDPGYLLELDNRNVYKNIRYALIDSSYGYCNTDYEAKKDFWYYSNIADSGEDPELAYRVKLAWAMFIVAWIPSSIVTVLTDFYGIPVMEHIIEFIRYYNIF